MNLIEELKDAERNLNRFISTQRVDIFGGPVRGYVDRLFSVSVVSLIFGLATQVSGIGVDPGYKVGPFLFQGKSLLFLQVFLLFVILYYAACLNLAARSDLRKWDAELKDNSDPVQKLVGLIQSEQQRIHEDLSKLSDDVNSNSDHELLDGSIGEDGVPLKLRELFQEKQNVVANLGLIARQAAEPVLRARRDARYQLLLLVWCPTTFAVLSSAANAFALFKGWRG